MTEDQGWDTLFEDGPQLPWRVRGGWLEGLSLNRGAPDDVVIRLFDHGMDASLARGQSEAVVLAAIEHPDRQVRAYLAEWQPGMSAAQWTALILAEPSAPHRAVLVRRAGRRAAGLTAQGYARLAADPAPDVRATAVDLPGLPAALLTALAADPEGVVRAAACGPAWATLSKAERDTLLVDAHTSVRNAALLRHHRDLPLPRPVFETLDQKTAAESCRLDRALAEELTWHEDPEVRLAAAGNPHMDADLVLSLAADPEYRVRLRASVHPGLNEKQRAAAIPSDLDPTHLRYDVPWVLARHEDPEEMRWLASSVHPALRSSVARAQRLPPDVVERLARDEDRVVRLFLAESCDDAPGGMLLEVWHWWTGSFSKPDRPRGHPNFPRAGLLRFAKDPNPRLRQLALDDPRSTAELVERFTLDPDDEVRRRAVQDLRLSPRSVAQLLDDANDGIRHCAAMHPALPVPALIRLLRTPGAPPFGMSAALNPAIPGPIMHRMIDLAAAGP
ncbi:PE-PGRS family protein [Streptomyces sp. NPDC008141]|uniref:PE-PGRS family protein n=1 Tax=Streptomyces sp. NPDC008141 TaxID=3364815 RepID=UPI0036F0CD29